MSTTNQHRQGRIRVARSAVLALALSFLPGACQGADPLHVRQVAGSTIPARRDLGEMQEIDRRRPAEAEIDIPGAKGEEPVGEEAHPVVSVERPRIGDSELRQLDLREAPLSEAIHLIASMAGVNIYLDSGLVDPVDASFPSVTLDDALGVLLDRNGLTLVEDPKGVYWVSQNDGNQLESATFHLRSINGEDVLANLQTLLGEDTTLVVDRNQNLVVVRGRRSDVEAARAYLADADHLKRQVLIEVEILEIILDDEYEFGLQHVISDRNFLGESAVTVNQDLSTGSDNFIATVDLTDFSLNSTINALSTYGIVRVVSSPRVMAITNTVAKIDVITEIPYVDVSTTIEGGGGTTGTSSQESVAFKEAGIKLEVTPVVQAGGVVQLSVNQEFSEVIDFFQGVPVLDTRKVVNQFLVNGRETAVIGGLMQDRASEVDRGVPVLMHIPLLGRLFRSDEDRAQKRELLILITPRELDPSEAAVMADRYQDRFQERSRAAGFQDVRER